MTLIDELGVNPEDLQTAVYAIKEMADNVDLLRQKFVRGADDVAKQVKTIDTQIDKLGGTSKKVVKTSFDLTTSLRDQRAILTEMDRTLAGFARNFDLIGRHFSLLDNRISSIKRGLRDMYIEGGVLTKTTAQRFIGNDVVGLTGNRGVGSFLASQASSLMGAAPAAGILGLFMYGLGGEATWRARSYEAARTFDAVAQTSQASIDRIYKTGKSLADMWGVDVPSAIAELKPSLAALANVGISSEAAGRNTDMGADVAASALGLDTYFKAGAGSFGNLIAQQYAITGRAADAAANDIYKVARAFEDTDVNVVGTLGSLMSISSAMKSQRTNVEDLAGAFQRLRTANQAARGGTSEANAQLALRGLQGIAGGLANIDEGYASILGRQLSGKRGLEAAYYYRDALDPTQQDFDKNLRQILNDAFTRTGGGAKMRKFLETTVGFGLEGSGQAMMLFKDKDFMAGKSALSVKDKLGFQSAAERRSAEQSEYEKTMKRLQTDLVNIGFLTLRTMVDGFRNLADLFKLLPFSGASEVEKTNARFRIEKRGERADELFSTFGKTFSHLGGPLSQVAADLRDVPSRDEPSPEAAARLRVAADKMLVRRSYETEAADRAVESARQSAESANRFTEAERRTTEVVVETSSTAPVTVRVFNATPLSGSTSPGTRPR